MAMKLEYKIDQEIFMFDVPSPLILGTAGKTFNNINYLNDLDLARNKEIVLLSDFLKINKNKIITLNQVHGDLIISLDSINNKSFPDADGIITEAEKCCLVIRTADCVPVFAFDRKNNILGAVHSGWKGCRLNISGSLIRKMKSEYRSKESDLHVYILPSIGPESYTVKMDIGLYFKDDIIVNNNKIYLDLWKNIYISLMREGIPENNIYFSGICTFKNNTDFFSYRYGDSGRNLNFAFIDSK